MTRITLGIVLLSATAIITSAPAQAQNGTLTRSFVSSAGLDSNPCTITQPCATFAHAYTKPSANGIIAALDPGKYGPLTITGPVTINGNGWAAVTAPAQGAGIIVNASTASKDIVNLYGIEIDGAGAAYNGIVFNSGGAFTVSNCVVGNFVGNTNTTGDAIRLSPNSSDTFIFDVNNTVLTGSSNVGLLYFVPGTAPTSKITIDHVAAKGNGEGILFDTTIVPGAVTTEAVVSNSVASNNFSYGINLLVFGTATTMTVAVDNTVVSGNGIAGIAVGANTHMLLGRSVITGNGDGVRNFTTPDNTFYTYADNRINGNTNDIGGGSSPSVTIPMQ